MPLRDPMILIAISAAFVGLVHSLAPGHWLPVVLLTKTRRWSWQKALGGAVVAASGHILISFLLGFFAIEVGVHLFTSLEEEIERYGALILVVFGLFYALQAYFRHSRCHGHTHHGPVPRQGTSPFLFLFTLGLSPCVAVLPIFATAVVRGPVAVALTAAAFSCGVLLAMAGGTLLVSLGLVKLDHPIFEHFGDVITGLGVSLMGVILFLL